MKLRSPVILAILRQPTHAIRVFLLLLVVLVSASSLWFVTPQTSYAAQTHLAFVRVNQIGYITDETKQAILLASAIEKGATFRVVDTRSGHVAYHAAIGASRGKWSSAFPNAYLLDFSALRAPGSYTIQVSGPIAASSPSFGIDSGAHLYRRLLSNALFFYQTQHDGANVDPNVLNRRPSHLADRQASTYSPPNFDNNDTLVGSLHKVGGPIDVSGGWFDAGDYLNFVQTASYTDGMMLFTARKYASVFQGTNLGSEARFGLDWLQKMWDNTSQTLYYQVGLGDGNGTTILGDHDFWRLPEADDALNARPGDPAYYVEFRPVFQAGPAGSPISPNLAGRMAAALALCYQIYHDSDPTYANRCLSSAENIFDLAKTSKIDQLLTVSPFDFYPETEWRDDLEWGATELYFATASGNLPTGLKHSDPQFYLKAAAHWAHAYITGPGDGGDSLNLYDVSGLAHYELYRALAQAGNPDLAVSKKDLLNDLNLQLSNGVQQAKSDPFGFGLGYGMGDASPHALGYSLEASFYQELTDSDAFETFRLTQRNWILGTNAWGSSFIVGAGSTFPHCMQDQVANLSGSLDGTTPLALGATTDGPNDSTVFADLGFQDGMRKCPTDGSDTFNIFSGKGVRYLDNVIAWPSVEPADDYTVLTLPVFAQQVLD